MKIPSEYSIIIPQERKSTGRAARLIQEWLCLNGFNIRIDGDYGPATEAAVRRFQTKSKMQATGVTDEYTYRALTAPMTRVCRMLGSTAESFTERVVAAARLHLKESPREVGGKNKGPWVRLYTGGKDGEDYPWCAGFVSYLMKQAAEMRRPNPMKIKATLSCDELVAQAKEHEMFVSEEQILSKEVAIEDLKPGTLFVIRNPKNENDWIHTGVVTAFLPKFVETIEGNTNDTGDREGYEVCKRLRSYRNMDFIRL